MDSKVPHLMTRANPGDTRCAECGMTSGTNAHREGRAAQQATQQAGDQGDQVPAVRELSPAELGGMHARQDTRFRAHSRRPLCCTHCTRSKAEHSVPVDAPAAMPVTVAAVLAGDQGDAPAPTRWVAKRNGRPVANPSQVDVVRGDVVRAPAAPATAPATDPIDQVDNVPAPAGESEGTNMRATVKRADLVTALTYACKGIPTHPSVPALAGVVITAAGSVLTAHTFDWDTYRAGDAPITDSVAGRIAVGGKTLLATVKALKARTVTLSATDTDVTVTGETAVTLPLMPTEDMPPVLGAHVIGSMDAGELARHIGAVAGAAGTDAMLPMVMSVRVRTDGRNIEFAATDRFRLHMSAGTWSPAVDSDGETLVAPGSEYLPAARLLSEVTSLYVRRAGKRPATVTILAGTMGDNPTYGTVCDGFRMITRSYVDAPYPPVEKLFPAAPAGTADVDAVALVDKVTHVSGGLKTPGNVIIVPDVPAGSITLEFWPSAGSDDAPAATATVPATFTGDVPAASAFTPRYLVDAVAPFAGTVRLESVAAYKPFVITGESSPAARNLVMPVRISGRADTPNVAAARVGVPAAVPAAAAPAPAVESADQGDQVPAGSDAVRLDTPAVSAARSRRDPRRVLSAVLRRRRAHPSTQVHVSVSDSGIVSCKGARPTDAEVSDAFDRPYAFTAEVPGIVGTFYRFTPVDQGDAPAPAGDSVDQAAVPAAVPAVPTDHPFTLPSHLVATYEALYAVALAAGYKTHTLWVPAGAGNTADDKWTTNDGVTLQIGTRDGYEGAGKSHVVVSWDSWTDVVRVQPGGPLHTIDQVRDYLAGYMDALTTCRFASDGLERIYRAVTDNHNPYANPLPRRPFSAAPAPADFERYADEIAGCVCPLCVALVDAVESGQGRDDAARALFTALYGTHKSPTHVRTVAAVLDAPAAVPAVDAPAPAVESADQGDQGTAGSVDVEAPAGDQGDAPAGELAGMVREIIAGATWSFGSGTIGGGKRQRGTRFHGPIMHPALPDRRLTREEWSALADQVRALGGGAWMRDVKGFACESGDAGNPWKRATQSTRERVAEWLTATAEPCGHRSEHKNGATCTREAGHSPANIHGDGTTNWFPYGVHADGTVDPGTSPEFVASVDQGDAPAAVPAAVPAVDAPAPAVESADQGDQVPAGSVDAGHPLAIDPSKPVTVTLVYSDRDDAPAAPAVETADQGDAPAGDQVSALAGDSVHGAHPQRVHVSGVGELNGYRFHLVTGVGCRQFGKPIRSALNARGDLGSFAVTVPSGSGTVNIAAKGDVADWSPVLALVAGIIGDKIAGDSATCAECDRSHALADH
jgi:DNA polymerase III subunit beta